MQIMSDSHFKYRSTQNQFQNDYVLVRCIIAYFSKRK